MKKPTTAERLATLEAYMTSRLEADRAATQQAIRDRIASLERALVYKDETIKAHVETIAEYKRQIDRLNEARSSR